MLLAESQAKAGTWHMVWTNALRLFVFCKKTILKLSPSTSGLEAPSTHALCISLVVFRSSCVEMNTIMVIVNHILLRSCTSESCASRRVTSTKVIRKHAIHRQLITCPQNTPAKVFHQAHPQPLPPNKAIIMPYDFMGSVQLWPWPAQTPLQSVSVILVSWHKQRSTIRTVKQHYQTHCSVNFNTRSFSKTAPGAFAPVCLIMPMALAPFCAAVQRWPDNLKVQAYVQQRGNSKASYQYCATACTSEQSTMHRRRCGTSAIGQCPRKLSMQIGGTPKQNYMATLLDFTKLQTVIPGWQVIVRHRKRPKRIEVLMLRLMTWLRGRLTRLT